MNRKPKLGIIVPSALKLEDEDEKCGSQILRNLENYSIEPSKNLQRKLDYFFSPYGSRLHYEKYMKFE